MTVRFVLATFFVLLVAAPAAAQDPSSDPTTERYEAAQRALQRGHDLVMEESWERAAEAFSQSFDLLMAAAGERPQWAPQVRDTAQEPLFWKCFADEKRAAPPAEVAECYEIFVLRYPDSKWADDARRNKARVQNAAAASQVRIRPGGSVEERFFRGEQPPRPPEQAEEQVLMTTIYALAEPGNDDVVPRLAVLARTAERPQVRIAAVRALHRVSTAASHEALASVVRSDAPSEVRVEAVSALGDLRSRAGAAALKAVAQDRNEDERVRERAAQALSRMPAADVVALLGRLAADEAEPPRVRRAAVEALQRIGTPEARAALVRLLDAQ